MASAAHDVLAEGEQRTPAQALQSPQAAADKRLGKRWRQVHQRPSMQIVLEAALFT